MEYDFKLTYRIEGECHDADQLMNKLGDAGCTDALVGLGVAGQVSLEFIREADSAEEAILSALRDVQSAIPNAKLIEAGPDFVGLTDVGDLVGLSRQNMRKVWLSHVDSFPAPVHCGATSVWHLAPVLQYLGDRHYTFARSLLDVARVTMNVNIARQQAMTSNAELEKFRRHLVF